MVLRRFLCEAYIKPVPAVLRRIILMRGPSFAILVTFQSLKAQKRQKLTAKASLRILPLRCQAKSCISPQQ